jgi:DNA-directed RNA polymerase specialized sigma subunit
MSERVEKLIKEYSKMKVEARCLELQIKDFKGISEDEMIESMNFSQPDGERVQTSNISNKPESIALSYHERMEEANRDWYEYLTRRYLELAEELRFFESAVRSLEGEPGRVLRSMLFDGLTWDEIEAHHHIGRMTVSRQRRAAIAELSKLYDDHENKMVAYLLS